MKRLPASAKFCHSCILKISVTPLISQPQTFTENMPKKYYAINSFVLDRPKNYIPLPQIISKNIQQKSLL